jgi:pSer/pThr/pTyr-binding forkhead associated (FHA) protein
MPLLEDKGRNRPACTGGGSLAESKAQIADPAVPPAAQRARLRINSGFYEGLEWELDRPSTVIGRGRNADLVLNEATISRAHALFGYEGVEAFVQDLGSTNGTLVNGAREHRKVLAHGDELRMGKLVLKVWLDAAVAGSASGV